MRSHRNRRDRSRWLAATVVAAVLLTTVAGADTQRTGEPAMMNGRNGWSSEALFTIGEDVDGYTPPGILDGLGAYRVDANTVRVLANHELSADKGYAYSLANGTSLTGARVSYIDFDRNTRRVCDAGLAYTTIYDRRGNVVDDAGDVNESGDRSDGIARLCSARLVEAGQYGFEEAVFFAGEETSTPSHPHGGTEWVLDVDDQELWACPELGRGAWENVTPIASGHPRRIALLLDDDSSGAPLYLWIGTRRRGDFLDRNGLRKGRLHVWVPDGPATDPGAFNGVGSTLAGSFVRIRARQKSRAGKSGYDARGYLDDDTLRDRAVSLGAFRFSRPEDLHDDPFDPTCAVLASTGRASLFPADRWGTIYKIATDLSKARRPTATLTIITDSDGLSDPDQGVRNPDNLTWAEDGFVYVQEDRSTSLFGASSGIEASVWAVDPTTTRTTRVGVIDRTAVPSGQTDGDAGELGSWESSGIIDVTRLFVTDPGEKLLLLCVQAHGIDLGNDRLDQGGQLILLSKGRDP